jgi:hypothetical protein
MSALRRVSEDKRTNSDRLSRFLLAHRRPIDRMAASFRDIMRAADARENKMAPVSNKFRDQNPFGAKMLAGRRLR